MKPVFLFALALVGCSDFHHIDEMPADAGWASPDAAVPDAAVPDAAAPDAAVPDAGTCDPIACPCAVACVDGRPSCAPCPDEACLPHVFRGCSDSETQWYWNGADCESIFECRNTGSPTRRSCLADHLVCDPDLDLEERSFALLDMRRTCTAGGDAGWSFIFIPSDEAEFGSLENVALSLRDGLSAASADVTVVVTGAPDPFHDLAAFEVGDPALEIRLCDGRTCTHATQGTFSFETGGAGLASATIDVRFGAESVAVDLHDTWFAYELVELDCTP